MWASFFFIKKDSLEEKDVSRSLHRNEIKANKLKVGVDNLLQVQIIHLTQQKNQIR